MGYFNYFIKCIIRNIAYKLCKPKVLLTILAFVAILFALHTTGYCADWTDGEIEACLEGLATITSNQGTIISQLSSVGLDVSDLETQLNTINTTINNIKVDTNLTVEKLHSLLNKVDSLNNTLVQLAQQQNIYYENVTNELEDIKKILIGADLESVDFSFEIKNYKGLEPGPFSPVSFQATVVDSVNMGYFTIDYNFEGGYTYDIICNSTNSTYSSYIFYTYDTIATGNYISVNYAITSTPASTAFSISPKKDSTVTLIFTSPVAFPGLMTWTITKKSSSSLSGINNTIEQGNQLQQQQNQLQQEQNDLIKDDNVNTDGFEFATNDTNNPTEDGFNTLFTSIYNAFCNTSSEPLTVTLPYINQTFTIQPNLVSNAMQKCGLGFVATLIHSFYYYGVCLFIYKDINKIIEHLKSGNLTADCGNVKTEVL